MSDEERGDERDEFAGMGDEALKMLLTQERRDHARELDELREEFSRRLDQLRAKVMLPGTARPGVIHPSDVRAVAARLPLDERQKFWGEILGGKIKVTTDAPPGKWLERDPNRPRVTRAGIQALPLDERVETQKKVLKGEIELVG